MLNKTFTSFTITDFLDDADFLRYIKYNAPADVAFWDKWQAESPANLEIFNAAKLQLHLILSDRRIEVPADFKDSLLKDINFSVNKFQSNQRKKVVRLIWTSGIAASMLLIAFVAWFSQSIITVKAEFAQNKLVHLPDGSEVQLNANSILTYPRAFNWKARREVHLTGEGYFKVKHINVNPEQIEKGELFVAITKAAHVQVLGTEFNLKERHNRTNIALVKGKVRVTALKTGTNYMMKPGDLINLGEDGKEVTDGNQLGNQTAWITGKIIVNQTSVNDILREFEDLYGYKVVLDNPALGNKKIDGAISIKTEESLLFTLKNILNVNIKKEGNTIYLKNRH